MKGLSKMLKCIKSLILKFAVSKAKEVATVENLAGYLCEGVNLLLERCAVRYVGHEKFEKICKALSNLGKAITILSSAMADGNISADEAKTIVSEFRATVYNFELTDEALAKAIDNIAERIQERL